MRIADSDIRAKLKNLSECAYAPVIRWYPFRLFTIFAVKLFIEIICLPQTRWPRLTLLLSGVLLQISFTILLMAWHRRREQVPSYDIFDPKYSLLYIVLYGSSHHVSLASARNRAARSSSSDRNNGLSISQVHHTSAARQSFSVRNGLLRVCSMGGLCRCYREWAHTDRN
jgi:hypothetical protein